MSNKKLFWIAFFILSCCELGQFAYSKNTSASVQVAKLSRTAMLCYEQKVIDSSPVFNGLAASYLLPR